MKEFLIDNYIWFLVIAIILALAMVGYFAEVDKKKNPTQPKPKKNKDNNAVDLPDLDMKPGMTLGDALNNNETQTPEKVEDLIVEELK